MLDVEFRNPLFTPRYAVIQTGIRGLGSSTNVVVEIPNESAREIWRVGCKPNNFVDELRLSDRWGNRPVEHFNYTGKVVYKPRDFSTTLYNFRPSKSRPHNVNYPVLVQKNPNNKILVDATRDYDSEYTYNVPFYGSLYFSVRIREVGHRDYRLVIIFRKPDPTNYSSRWNTYVLVNSRGQVFLGEANSDTSDLGWIPEDRDKPIPTSVSQWIANAVAKMDANPNAYKGREVTYLSTTLVNPGQPYSKDGFVARLRKLGRELMLDVVPDESELQIWGDLSERACLQCKKVQSNMLSTLIELFTLRGDLTDLVQSGQDFLSLMKTTIRKAEQSQLTARALCRITTALTNLRLSMKWGTPLTVKDATECLDVFVDEIVKECETPSVSVARESVLGTCHGLGYLSGALIVRKYNECIYYNQKDLREAEFVKNLADWGFLSFENGWDMIPYSFVVDWFTSFGDNVRKLDSILYRTCFLDTLGSVCTTTTTFEVPTSAVQALVGLNIEGRVFLKHYYRRLYDVVPLPIFSTGKRKLGFDQYLDGTSLILQRV